MSTTKSALRETKTQRVARIAKEAYMRVLPKAAQKGWTKKHDGDWEPYDTVAQKQWKAAVNAVLDILAEEKRNAVK